VRQEDRAKFHNVNVIPKEECVPKYISLVTDMQFNITKRWHKKFEPRVHVWKLKEEKTCEYQSMVKNKVAEAEWKCLDAKEHCKQMKNMMEIAQFTCGLLKGLCSLQVVEAIREKKNKYGNWKKKKNRQRHGRSTSTRRVNKIQRGLFP